VVASDVITVAVCGDGDHRLVEQVGQLVDEARHAHAGVDDHVAVATADVPDVAAHQLDHVWFPQQGDVIGIDPAVEPTVGNGPVVEPGRLLRRRPSAKVVECPSNVT